MSAQVPTVGRIVHYRSLGSADGRFASECRAAVVTQTGRVGTDGAEWVGLAVLNPTGLFFDADIPQDEAGKAGGTWHWPERV